ncbi:MAG: S-methyl-5-thioribose-1-phosphate isomerase [Chlorobi bacterium]|nr:S-methyl-5-thioribose-1-phosphate isomerase [Chlorobiota bacterium]
MKIKGKHFQTIWLSEESDEIVQAIDQRKLPFVFEILDLATVTDVYNAIRDMAVRGAPLIGITGAYGIYLALLAYNGNKLNNYLDEVASYLKSSRPTAVNLAFAIDEVVKTCRNSTIKDAVSKALKKTTELKEKEVEYCSRIGNHGLALIEGIYKEKKRPVNVLTHCNAGWLACIDWGTATAPVYKASQKGIPVHVWVDETRPRNQGARLTAFELAEEGIPHTIIPDNTGGHLMQHGEVDLVIVGSDRTTVSGDVANKIGTYLKALAAHDNQIPFYVALPSSSIDWGITDGMSEIPIEQRDPSEVGFIEGWAKNQIISVRLTPEKSKTANYGFDVTPARLVTGLITEKGICKADKKSITTLFPEKKYLWQK